MQEEERGFARDRQRAGDDGWKSPGVENTACPTKGDFPAGEQSGFQPSILLHSSGEVERGDRQGSRGGGNIARARFDGFAMNALIYSAPENLISTELVRKLLALANNVIHASVLRKTRNCSVMKQTRRPFARATGVARLACSPFCVQINAKLTFIAISLHYASVSRARIDDGVFTHDAYVISALPIWRCTCLRVPFCNFHTFLSKQRIGEDYDRELRGEGIADGARQGQLILIHACRPKSDRK